VRILPLTRPVGLVVLCLVGLLGGLARALELIYVCAAYSESESYSIHIDTVTFTAQQGNQDAMTMSDDVDDLMLMWQKHKRPNMKKTK